MRRSDYPRGANYTEENACHAVHGAENRQALKLWNANLFKRTWDHFRAKPA